jgi:heme-degrading monooxygenase HmoA
MAQYATLGKLTLAPGKRAIAEGIADQGVAGVAQQPGFISVIFFLNEERNEYGAFSLWESREAAEAANAVLTPQFEQAFGEHLEGPIESILYEVYEPNRA